MKNKQSHNHRVITLSDINDENTNDVIQFIHEINYVDMGKQREEREPIKLIINSYGGDVYRGFGVIDSIINSVTPVHTICYGAALSMGLPIMVSGHHRTASKNSTFMYHELLWSLHDSNLSTHRNEVEEGKRIMDRFDYIMLSYTNITKEQLDIVKQEHRDWYLDTEDALLYGIIDEVI
jgi:ATP-dependent Clp protease protease subunit